MSASNTELIYGMRQNRIHNILQLNENRRVLRNYGTSAEATLWKLLKNSQLHGRKFRRQHSIEHYIADFYCPAEKLVIELDGQVHRDPLRSAYDAERDARLRGLGFTVLRFENRLVFDETEFVLECITSAFRG
jgi:very-short-patch-repair endonuclease